MILKKKLVRDKIHEIYKDRPRHVADSVEYELELTKKLQEEVEKYKLSRRVEELVDIIEICYALSEFQGVPLKELEDMRIDKANKRGRFKKRIIFEEVNPDSQLDFEDQQQ